MWAANAVEISDWWQVRSNAIVTPAYSITGDTYIARAVISGTPGSGTAVDVAIPNRDSVSGLQVYLDGQQADPADYRNIGNTIKIRVGASTSFAEVRYTFNTVNNPVPALASLSPVSATAGSAGFTLTLDGSNFINGSVVQWNGSNRTTTFVSAARLTAAIPASDLEIAGTATVTVFTAAPGGGVSNAQIFTINDAEGGTWTQTDWAGGGGQFIWSDQTRYDSSAGIDSSANGNLSLSYGSAAVLFSDDFTRSPDNASPLSPWVAALGSWSVTGGVMRGTGSANQYSYASYPASQWTDYSVQGRIQLPAGSFGGGLGGRVNASTGTHYGAWVYPTGSAGGSNMLKLWKFRGWTDLGAGVAMQQVSLPAVGTGWHTLQMTFTGNRIQVYYDGVLKIDVTDNNFDSRPAYLSGGISADWWTWSLPYTITIDDISVAAPTAYGNSGVLVSSAFDGGGRAVADPVLGRNHQRQYECLRQDPHRRPGRSACQCRLVKLRRHQRLGLNEREQTLDPVPVGTDYQRCIDLACFSRDQNPLPFGHIRGASPRYQQSCADRRRSRRFRLYVDRQWQRVCRRFSGPMERIEPHDDVYIRNPVDGGDIGGGHCGCRDNPGNRVHSRTGRRHLQRPDVHGLCRQQSRSGNNKPEPHCCDCRRIGVHTRGQWQ